jgi:predicted  nucleic acid-binding Zn-ribbon protein
MTIKNRKEINSEVTKLELEKELLVKEKSALRKKIGDKKREISALRKQLKKAGKYY